ncbi:hypothetical protein ABH968_002695 [Lysinibacillus sp. RC79]
MECAYHINQSWVRRPVDLETANEFFGNASIIPSWGDVCLTFKGLHMNTNSVKDSDFEGLHGNGNCQENMWWQVCSIRVLYIIK